MWFPVKYTEHTEIYEFKFNYISNLTNLLLKNIILFYKYINKLNI